MRIVIKVGSAVLSQDGAIATERMQALVDFIALLKKENEVLLVSSGAVSAGYTKLQIDRSVLANKQALAAIGQPVLMNRYAKKFAEYKIITSQVLVTAANLKKEDDICRIQNTINTLINNGVLPIINENDATATDELEVGDNDQLSAYIANHMGADQLVILSDIDAYYDKDPRAHEDAQVLKVVSEISEDELRKDVTPNNLFATGGIVTKLKAANYLLGVNIDTFLASGFDLSDVRSFLLNKEHKGGTLFSKGVK